MDGYKRQEVTLERVETAGDGNWGWPDHLILTLKRPDGGRIEALVQVDEWRHASTKEPSP